MSQDDFQTRIFLKHATEYQPERMRGGFDSETPDCAHQDRIIVVAIAFIIRLDDGLIRDRRMQVDRNIKLDGSRKNRPEFLVVEKIAACESVDKGAFEGKFGDRALQFVGGSLGIWCGQRSEAGKPVRSNRNPFMQD